MKFAVVSDIHAENHFDWSKLVFQRMGARTDLDFVAFLGDVCTDYWYSWKDFLFPLRGAIVCPFYAVKGNHDPWDKWEKYFRTPNYYSHVVDDCLCLFMNSECLYKEGFDWLEQELKTPARMRFFFTHFPPKNHWEYSGFDLYQSQRLCSLLESYHVTAAFFGHMHGFDVVQQNGTYYFLCAGGGGGSHDNCPILHRSNFYVLVEATDRFHVSLCQQHKDREQVRPMEEWIGEKRRAIGGVF